MDVNIRIDLENCYGIKKLDHTFNFSNGRNTHLVYAPNGTMKTSFAKTMKFLSGQSENKPMDQLNPSADSKNDAKLNGNSIGAENIFVVNGDDEIDSSKSFINFLASSELKNRYDVIYQLLTESKKDLLSKLKSISKSTDCEGEIFDTFKLNADDSIFAILERISSEVNNNPFFDIKYNAVFDKNGRVKKFISDNRNDLQTYIVKYNELLSQSRLYRSVNGYSFGTYQANQLSKSVQDFFQVDHKIVLQDGQEITSVEQFQELMQTEQNRILEDNDLKQIFKEITDKVNKNKELRDFEAIIRNQPILITEILNYEEFRKKVWLGYLAHSEIKPLLDSYVSIYNENKDELNNILEQANQEQDKWEEIIELYNTRFNVPIKVEIQNQRDIILKQEAAKLRFYYKEGEQRIKTEQKQLYDILSRGEKRAFIILQFLFEMEARKLAPDYTLVVMDDIADSFDYQNKYAIIEYIKDLAEDTNNKFYLLILTHNYDFYRTIANRLQDTCPGNNIWMVDKENNGNIILNRGKYIGNVFEKVFVGKDDNDKIFISMIPFVRNLIEYTKGQSSLEFIKLTSCLHIKTDTKTISERDVINILKDYTLGKGVNRVESDRSIYSLIMNTADGIIQETNVNPVNLENKIVLSIAIRLLAEEYLQKKYFETGKTDDDFKQINNKQTGRLVKIYKNSFPDDANRYVVEKVNMMTPEHIHINSFMFEPLIDISVNHLITLYKECKDNLQ
ncbi:hypothetical protein CAPN006_02370 [Capnocytophaga canimorsus]|uniref:AAA family ATPase n=1 Tax=Capnocytophaga canimorsus TaxID=28188 RepID=UPI001AD221A7|nr:AAA family ATPase [Capnocytophaga canimorsus]GIM55843.1 hypothetical protein CAPN006_02370 [Capnocytophaga canimorsus]